MFSPSFSSFVIFSGAWSPYSRSWSFDGARPPFRSVGCAKPSFGIYCSFSDSLFFVVDDIGSIM